MKHLLLPVFLFISIGCLQGQDNSRLTGNLQTNGNFFIKDSAIGASGTPQYDNLKFGAESWLNLNYSNWGFDMGLRFDLFSNSNLLNPNGLPTATTYGWGPLSPDISWWITKVAGSGSAKDYAVGVFNNTNQRLYISLSAYARD